MKRVCFNRYRDNNYQKRICHLLTETFWECNTYKFYPCPKCKKNKELIAKGKKPFIRKKKFLYKAFLTNPKKEYDVTEIDKPKKKKEKKKKEKKKKEKKKMEKKNKDKKNLGNGS